MSQKPLEDIVVLDLSRVLAGPYCTMLLRDLGAEIIKVERPGTGDDSRGFGPFVDGKSVYFVSINYGKKSIALNLKEEGDRDIFLEFVKKADVLVENFRPGTMEKLGFSYQKLKNINSRLIYAAISGYGHSGPYSRKAAYDIIVQAEGGIMSITGNEGGSPVRVGTSVGDITAALFTANGIMSALYQREKTGEGQKVDISMLDSQIAILENAVVRYAASGKSPGPLGSRHPSITPFEAFKASDDWVIIAAGNDSLWAKFCRAIDREDLIEHPDFVSNELRTKNHKQLKEIIDEVVAEMTAEEVVELLSEYGIPTTRVNKIEDVFNHPQVKPRNMLLDVDDPVVGKIKIAGNPIKMSAAPEDEEINTAPDLDENRDELLKDYYDNQA